MSICRLNRSSKVCMKKGPARHTRTPQSSLPEPNIILILYFLHILSNRDSVPKPIFLGAWHFPISRTSRFEPIYYLMNIVSALPADHRRSPLSKVFYNRPLLIGPTFINFHSVCLVIGTCYCEVFFYAQWRSAGRATILA